jgi:hypothetical protein
MELVRLSCMIRPGIAVVTSQPGQVYKPLSDAQLKTFGVPKEQVFENTTGRLLYQDRTAAKAEEPNAYSAQTARTGGTCSCHVVFGHGVAEDIAKKIALSLGPVAAEQQE